MTDVTLWLVDGLVLILYSFKWLAVVLALLMLAFGLDDLFIDCVYWVRRLWRRYSIYNGTPRADESRLYEQPEKPLAVMVPAWKEVGVVGQMAQLMATTMDYENYQIFVGTYPNDPETQAEVDAVCQTFHNVHKVVTTHPGPTSKADCLNNVIKAISRFEQAAGIQFAGCILHDAEDVISPMELRLFNYLLPHKDLIQVPVYPFRSRWYELSGGHYIDEFSEYHGKDVMVREAMCGQVPSAGVGTCFSRHALAQLRDLNDGITFNIWSLTEDYDIGFSLHEHNLSCIFVRYSVKDGDLSPHREHSRGQSHRDSRVICVREHFPTQFQAVVRQKSRWITGIVFQGYQHLGWSRYWRLNYFLWRDRRGLITYPIALAASFLLIMLLCLWLSALLLSDGWRFPDILSGPLLSTLLIINGCLLANRAFQRFYFVKIYYGWQQGLLSFPRMLWSNVVNFMANLRAWNLFFTRARHRTFAWDKTTHEFPLIDAPRQIPLEDFLVEDGVIDQATLSAVLATPLHRRLDRELLIQGKVSSEELVRALARKHNIPWMNFNPMELTPSVIAMMPARIAMRYAALPIAEQENALIVVTETPLSPVAQGAISRRLKRPIIARLVPAGRVTLGLRHWHLGGISQTDAEALALLDEHTADDQACMDRYCGHQVVLGQLLLERRLIAAPLFGQAMIDFDPDKSRLGEFLITRGMIDDVTLSLALTKLEEEQRLATAVLRRSPA